MSEELTLEYLNERINSRKWENRRLAQVVSQQNNAILEQKNAILEGFGCHQSLEEFPDRPEVCDRIMLRQRGGKKERKRPHGIGIKQSPSEPQTVGDNQPQPDIRILLLLEDLVRANVILNHPNFNTLPEEDRIELQAAYAQSRQELIQAGFTQQQLNDFLQQMQQGGKKSRKKRGKGAMVSRMSRKKKLSARKPKPIYVDEAIKILENDQTYLIADIVEKGRRIRNLALELEDNAKKGGRRKRKSRRKTKKRRRSRRRKSRRRRR